MSASNGWKITFKVSGDGSYAVVQSGGSGYSTNVFGNTESGFVIENTILKMMF